MASNSRLSGIIPCTGCLRYKREGCPVVGELLLFCVKSSIDHLIMSPQHG